jgi:hypothetical protein
VQVIMFNRLRFIAVVTPTHVVIEDDFIHERIEALRHLATESACCGCDLKPAGENCSIALVVHYPKSGSILQEGLHYVFCSHCAKDLSVKDIKKRVKALVKARVSRRKKGE